MADYDAHEILLESLTRAEKDVRALLDGGKPVIDQRTSGNAWIVDQLTRLRAGFFISEIPFAYTTTPQETEEVRRWKGDTRYHPLGNMLMREQKAMAENFRTDDIKNFKVLGVDYGFRNTQDNPVGQAAYADNFVLAKGDVYSLWQFIELLKAKIQHDPAMEGKTLVLQNTDGFWDPVINALHLDNPALEQQGLLHITDSYGKTAKIIEQAGPAKDREPRIADSLKIEPGSTILVATHTSNKVHEARAIFEALKADVRVLPFNILEKPEEAKETSLTYSGNDMEKVKKAWKRIDQVGPEQIEAILRERGFDPAKTWILFDDRGLELAEPLMKNKLFDECRSYLNPYKPGPGVELASVLKSMSREDLHARLRMAADQLEAERGTPVDMSANELATYMFSPVLPGKDGKRSVYEFMAIQDNFVVPEPRPANDICKYPEHFIEPKDDPQHRTAAEIPDFIETKSCAALAAQTAAYTLGMESHAENIRPRVEFNEKASGRLWNIGTQHTLFGGDFPARNKIEGDGKFSFIDGASRQFDPLHATATGGDIQSRAACLNNYYDFAQKSDAFLLTPDEKKDDKKFAQQMFTFFSNIVGKQIDDPVFAGKPFIVMDGADTAWETAMDVYYHLHKNGFAGDKPKHVFKRRDSFEGTKDESALGYIGDYLNHYVPDHVSPREFREKGKKAPSDLFRVTIYCSATSTNQNYQRQAHDLTYDLASEGFAVKNGGGTDGLMAQTSKGVLDFRLKWLAEHPGKEIPPNHISSIQCEDTYKSEGLCDFKEYYEATGKKDFTDYVCVHPNIFQRMADLTDTDGEIVLWGGAGTVQEMMGSIMLREAGITPVENRPMVIVNAEIGIGAHRTRVFDPLIEAMPAWYREKLNVHVVNTTQEALELIREARRARGMEPTPATTPVAFRPGADPSAPSAAPV